MLRQARLAEVDAFGRRRSLSRVYDHGAIERLAAVDLRHSSWPWMRIDDDPLPSHAAEDGLDVLCLERASDRDRADGIAASPDAENQRSRQTSAASDWPATSRMISAARSNSSSAMTGVPSKGRSRSMSTQERQPWYSSRTRTVTGRGIR